MLRNSRICWENVKVVLSTSKSETSLAFEA